MKHFFGGITCLFSLLSFTIPVAAAGPRTLSGHVPAVVQQLQPLGDLPGTNRLQLAIGLPLRNAAGLSNLLQQIYDPASTNFHHYLTPEQFAQQFGPSETDYQALIAFAHANGLTVTATHSNRMLLDVNGSAVDVGRAFHLKLKVYQHPIEHRRFYAPDREPSLDLTVPVLHISGLNNYSLPQPRLKTMQRLPAQNTAPSAVANAGSGPSGAYMGNDFRAAYVPDTALTGAGQTVGLLQFDGYTSNDIAYYEKQAGLPSVSLTNVLIDGATGNPSHSGGEVEVSLDIETSISMAPGLAKVIVYEAPNPSPFVDLLNRMATDNLARQLSCSWYVPNGTAEPAADLIFQQMAAQGQSFFNASGDNDAYTGLISFPGDTPYITQVGGTTLTTSGPGGTYTSETVWNWGISRGPAYNGIGSGGGISTQYSIPAYQTNIIMTLSRGSTTMRNTPDVALTADNVYVRADAYNYNVGGTSCAAPLWAGFAALVNQQAAASGKPSVGLINPAVDAIGSGANYTTAFHDITTGNNTRSGSPTKFYAVTGYDLCTGWGTPAGQKLIDALANPEPLVITPATGFASAGGFGGPFTVTSETFTLTNGGTNILSWTLANTSAWLNVTSNSGTLTPGGPAAFVTVSLNNAASNLVVGTYTSAIYVTNLNDNFGQSRQFTLNVVDPPTITQQPVDQAVLEGATAAFNVSATGGLPLAYQWQFNGTNLVDGGNIAGSSTTNLLITGVSSNNVGTYTVVVTNVAGIAVSSNAQLTITPSAPMIVMQPSDLAVGVDETATFSVSVIGTSPYFYQWNFGGTNLVGATNSVLVLTNVQFAEAGQYSVTITNLYGSTNSAAAKLTVVPCEPAPLGLVDWWQGEDNANDIIGTNNGTLIGGTGFTNGEVGQAFSFNGTSNYVSIPDSPSLDSLTNAMTVELWVKSYQTNANSDWVSLATKGNSSWRLMGTSGAKTAYFAASGTSADVAGTRTINDGQWHHVAGVYDGTNIMLYVDGTLDASQPSSGLIAQNSYAMALGADTQGPFGVLAYFLNGAVDEASLYNRALSANEIATIYIAGKGGKCFNPVAPTIAAQPTNQTVNAGDSATFTVTAVGTLPLYYQWNLGGTNLPGATGATLTLTNVQPANAGFYSVTVTNLYGFATSSNATLTVLTYPPIIQVQPISQTNFVGTTASFAVTVSGTAPLSYQWSLNTTNIAGATNATLTLANLQTNEAGYYAVTITNLYGATNSATAVLTINPPPSCAPVTSGLVDWWQAEADANDLIGTNNGSLASGAGFTNGEVGQAFSFNGTSSYVSIPDSPSLDSLTGAMTVELWVRSYQTNANSNWVGIATKGSSSWRLQGTSGAKTAYFAASGTSGGDVYGTRNINDGQWHHVAGVYDGTNLMLYVDGTLDASKPSSGAIAQDSYPMALGANTQGAFGSPAYFFNGSVDEASLYNRALSSNEIFLIYITGKGGKCFNPVAPAITTQPTNQTVNAGNSATFTVAAVGTLPLRYQWNLGGTNLPGATSATFTLTNVQPANAGAYAVTVTNLYGVAVSSNAMLTVLTYPPTITAQPASQTNFAGTTATFSVTAGGTAPLGYQWSFNTTNLAGATNAILTLTNVQLNQAGYYAVAVTNLYGATNSATAVLTVNPPPFCDPAPSGLVDWWQAEANANDAIGTNNGTLTGGVGFTDGEVGQAFSFNGSSSYVSIPDSPSLDSLTNAITVELWVKSYQTNANSDWVSLATKGNSSWRLMGTSGAKTAYFAASGTSADVAGTRTINDGQWHHVAGVYDGTNIMLYVDGTLDASKPSSGLIAQNSYAMALGADTQGPIGSLAYFFNGAVDEASLYNRALSSNEIAAIYITGKGGKCVNPVPPIILTQPASQTNFAGTTVTFGVIAAGAQPLSYQWSFNTTNIVGSTNATLILTNIQLNQAGYYAVAVTNLYGATNSATAVLTVNPPPPCDPAPSGLVDWWQAEANANDTIGTNNGTLIGGTGFTNGEVGLAFSFNGTSSYVSIPDSLSLDSLTNAITVELWVKSFQTNANSDWVSLATKGNSSWRLMGTSGAKTAYFAASGTSGDVAGTRTINDGQWHHVAGVYDGTNIMLYVDGTLDASQPSSGLIAQNSYAMALGADTQGPFGGIAYFFNGAVDEASLYDRALSSNEIAAIYITGKAGKCPLPPTITSQPTNETVMAGATATFNVSASSSAPLFYQWSFNGTNILGATNSSLTLADVQLNQAGAYAVQVANTGGTTNSASATLTVNSAPLVTMQPAPQTNYVGTAATFTVAVSGTAPLSYQWQCNNTNLPAATNMMLVLTNLQFNQAGSYSVLVTNAYGSALSSNAVLVINPFYHFVWSTIPSPRFVGTPFTVTVQVQDPTNSLATNFNSTVMLLTTNGLLVSPAISGNFIQGVWTGTVEITQTGSNVVLQATDSYGETGLANPINVVSLPPLTATPSGGTMYISWPASPSNFVLETSPDMSPGSWVPVSAPPVKIGDQYLEPITLSTTNAFYRLHFTGQ